MLEGIVENRTDTPGNRDGRILLVAIFLSHLFSFQPSTYCSLGVLNLKPMGVRGLSAP